MVSSFFRSLEKLSYETNPFARQKLLRKGFKKILKWFTLASRMILNNKIKLPKQTSTYMEKHRTDLQQLADPKVDLATKRKIILKPGGGGFFGGVIIRNLIRWDGKKTVRAFNDTFKKTRRVRKSPPKRRQRKSPKKNTSQKNHFAVVPRTPRRKTKTKAQLVENLRKQKGKVSPLRLKRVARTVLQERTPPSTSTHSPLQERVPTVARFTPLNVSRPTQDAMKAFSYFNR